MSGNDIKNMPQIDLLKIKDAVVILKTLCGNLHDVFYSNKCKFCPLRAKDSDEHDCYFQQLYDDESSAEPMEWTVTDIEKIPRIFE